MNKKINLASKEEDMVVQETDIPSNIDLHSIIITHHLPITICLIHHLGKCLLPHSVICHLIILEDICHHHHLSIICHLHFVQEVRIYKKRNHKNKMEPNNSISHQKIHISLREGLMIANLLMISGNKRLKLFLIGLLNLFKM